MLWRSLIPYQSVLNCGKYICNVSQRSLERQERKMLLEFMMKLNEDYATIRSNILMMKPVPMVAEAYRNFAQEESQRAVSFSSQHDSLAFYADKRKFSIQIPRFPKTQRPVHKEGTGRDSGDGAMVPFNQRQNYSKRGDKSLFCTNFKMTNHTRGQQQQFRLSRILMFNKTH